MRASLSDVRVRLQSVEADGQEFAFDVPEELVEGKGRPCGGTRHQRSRDIIIH